MKKVIAILLILPLFCHAQIQVVKKATKVIEVGRLAWSTIIFRHIVNSDTSYSYSFRNTSYQEIVDVKTIQLTKAELKELAKAFATAINASYDDKIWVNHISISKEKGPFGGLNFGLYYDGGFCTLKPKDLNKLLQAIEKE